MEILEKLKNGKSKKNENWIQYDSCSVMSYFEMKEMTIKNMCDL